MRHHINIPVALAAVFVMVTGIGSAVAGPQARVGGTVVGTDGSPVAGATITITCAALPKYNKIISSDDKGEFKVLILDATNTYLFTVTAPGFLDYNEEIKVAVGTTDNEFTFTLSTQKERSLARQQEIMERPGYKEYGEAKELFADGRTAEARARLEDALKAMPDLLEALEMMASIDFESGDAALALATARRCLDEDDESQKCLAVASNAAGLVGDSEAQAAYLARYQGLNPDDPATLFNQAAGFLNKMDDDSARPLLEACLAADPGFAKCLFEYGMLLLRTGDLEGAKAQFEKYLEVAPDGPDAATVSETIKYL
jgi:tetratricopeptide (TPR) repeat protein